MSLTREQVAHVALLCRLSLTEEELERMRGQLSSILEHVNRLQEVDTSTIQPTASVLDLRNVARPDASRPSLPPEDVLVNAPDREGDLFRVHAILEEG